MQRKKEARDPLHVLTVHFLKTTEGKYDPHQLCDEIKEYVASRKGKGAQTKMRTSQDVMDEEAGMVTRLIEEGLITISGYKLRSAASAAQKAGELLSTTLVRQGYLSEQTMVEFLSRTFGIPSTDLDKIEGPDETVRRCVPIEVAQRHCLVPIARNGQTLLLAMANPNNIFARDDVRFLTGLNIETVVAPEPAIRRAIERYYPNDSPLFEMRV